jgi:hypothetical protein
MKQEILKLIDEMELREIKQGMTPEKQAVARYETLRQIRAICERKDSDKMTFGVKPKFPDGVVRDEFRSRY